MNNRALQNDLNKALALVAKRHGVSFNTDVNSASDESVSLTLTFGERMDANYIAYLKERQPSDLHGHNYLKISKKGLVDEMLGRVFNINGKQMVYIGCKMNRPKYPVSMLRVDGGGKYTMLKCTMFHLDKAIQQHAPELRRQQDSFISETLNRADPDLPEGASW
jgi:hypothetical protein